MILAFFAKKKPKLIKKWRKSLNLYFNIDIVFFDLINLDYILKIQKKCLHEFSLLGSSMCKKGLKMAKDDQKIIILTNN